LALALGLRLWHFSHTEVIARDSIGFLRVAWRLGLEPWSTVVRESHQHPGYPVAVLGTATVFGLHPTGEDLHHPRPELASEWQTMAQITSAIAGTLLVIPMFFLGRSLFGDSQKGKAAAMVAALVPQCLPSVGRLFTDGLSEGLFLLFAAFSLLGARWALQSPRFLPPVLAGIASGLAYLVRPEGAFLGAWLTLGLFILAYFRPEQRLVRLSQAGWVILALVLVGGPYAFTIGHLTSKPTARQILQGEDSPMGWPGGSTPLPEYSLNSQGGSVPLAMAPMFAVWWEGGSATTLDRVMWGLKTLGFSWIKGMFWVLWVPQLVFLWKRRSGLFHLEWIPLWGLVATMLAALFKVASQMGYLSDRHLALLILLGSYPAAMGIWDIVEALGKTLNRWENPAAQLRWGMGIALILLGATLVRTLEPLHANRAGFREAGQWIAKHAAPGDPVTDAYCWSHYHAGRVFIESAAKGVPISLPPRQYFVVERSSNRHPRLQTVKEEDLKARGGQEVWVSAPRKDKDRAVVVVYELPWEGPPEGLPGAGSPTAKDTNQAPKRSAKAELMSGKRKE